MRALRISGPALMLLSALGCTLPVSAQQFDKTFYIGAGAAVSELEPRVNQSQYQVTESLSFGGQAFMGADLARYFSIEGYYRYLGEAELTRDANVGTIQYQTAGLNGLLYVFSSHGHRGLRNRTGLMLYGRAGVGYLDNMSDDVEFVRLQSTHFATGVGMEYGWSNGVALRAEFLNHDADARDISLNLIKRFGRKAELDLIPVEAQPLAADSAAPDAPIDDASTATDTDAVVDVAAPVVEQPVVEEPVTPVVETPPPPPPPMPDWDKDDDGVLDENDECADTREGALVKANGCEFTGILKGVTFATGSAHLTEDAKQILDEVARALAVNSLVKLKVEAHTDNRGKALSNMELSQRRATSVVRYLADVGGIDLARMGAIGYGESRPVQSNRTAAGRQANRRVEISVDN
jgi:outer membrane protein OmpA-like peptidoglycan-associated protein